MISHFLRDLQKLAGSRDIRRHAEIGPFCVDQLEEVVGERCENSLLGALAVGLREGDMAGHCV